MLRPPTAGVLGGQEAWGCSQAGYGPDLVCRVLQAASTPSVRFWAVKWPEWWGPWALLSTLTRPALISPSRSPKHDTDAQPAGEYGIVTAGLIDRMDTHVRHDC